MEKKQSNLDAVSILGTLVCGAVLVVMMFRGNRSQVEYQPPAAPPAAVQTADAPAVPVAPPADLPPLKAAPPAEPVELVVPGYMVAYVDPTGQGVRSVKLEQYGIQTNDTERKDERLVMGKNGASFLNMQVEGVAQLYPDGEPVVDGTHVRTRRIDASRTFSFQEEWRVVPGSRESGYTIQYGVTVTNLTGANAAVPRISVDCGALPPFLSDEQNTSFSRGVSGAVAYGSVAKDKAVIFTLKEVTAKLTADKLMQHKASQMTWLSVGSKYFLFALRQPTQDGQPIHFTGFDPSASMSTATGTPLFHARAFFPGATLAPGQSVTWNVEGYAGPKDYRRLQAMGQKIESIMGMDLFFFGHFAWMGWICRILLECLVGIANLVGAPWGYGLGIIVITLAVKVIFLPLSWKSTRDMRKMSAVMPEIKALREKYQGDPQRLYHEQQKLYRERGVSQLGGCLPMLVQIPVFFAMFNTFRAAIEIRNTPFLWAADLSMPDAIFGLPIHPLALATGLTMFLQQQLTPTADPSQGRMMNMMSLVFVFFFYQMPAALTLYMTVNSLFTIGQMILFRRWEGRNAAAAKPQGA